MTNHHTVRFNDDKQAFVTQAGVVVPLRAVSRLLNMLRHTKTAHIPEIISEFTGCSYNEATECVVLTRTLLERTDPRWKPRRNVNPTSRQQAVDATGAFDASGKNSG